MNTMQTIIVYSWFLPAAGLIVLPLLWSICGMLYRALERSRLSDTKGFIMLNNKDAVDPENSEKRSRPRIRLEEGKACIDAECDCCKALVSNISNQGIGLQNIPRRMYLESDPLRIIFRTRNKDYSLIARTKWKKMVGNGYVIGAEVIRNPADWKVLVQGLSESLQPELA